MNRKGCRVCSCCSQSDWLYDEPIAAVASSGIKDIDQSARTVANCNAWTYS